MTGEALQHTSTPGMVDPKEVLATLGGNTALTDDGGILRRYNACLMCRKRKLKCDGIQPGCSRCRATGHKCEYKYAAIKTKTQLLQDRIQELESQIESIESRSGSSLGPAQSSKCSSDRRYSILLPTDDPPFLNLNVPAPGPLGFRSTLPLSPTLARREPPADLLSRLLGVFMQRSFQCGFELHIYRVLRSFQSGAMEPAVVALFNAILLMASHFAEDPDLKAWEPKFLERTKWEIETNITRAHGSISGKEKYNALYHLQAMSMLGQYFYFCGRMLEGYVHTTQATQFAVALGIHRLNSRILNQYTTAARFRPEHPSWQPRDSVELGEAINLWWVCATRDLAGSTLNGLPPTISLDEVITVWPYSLSSFEDGQELPDDSYSISSLLDPNFSHMIADASQGSLFCILCKACVLMYISGKLDVERIASLSLTVEWWNNFEECSRTIDRFMQTVPPVYTGHNFVEVAFIATIHTALDCSTIQLHSALAEYEFARFVQRDPGGLRSEDSMGGDSYKRCINACRNMALATLQLEHIDLSYIHMFIGVTWVGAAEFLARRIPMLKNSGYVEQAHEMERQMAIMERGMERLLVVYPVLSLQAEKLRSLRTW